MDRHAAYRIATQLLERYRALPFADLVAHIDHRGQERIPVSTSHELLAEVTVNWADSRREKLRIDVEIDACSTFRLERVEEHVIVSPAKN